MRYRIGHVFGWLPVRGKPATRRVPRVPASAAQIRRQLDAMGTQLGFEVSREGWRSGRYVVATQVVLGDAGRSNDSAARVR